MRNQERSAESDREYATKVMALDRIPRWEELRYTNRFSKDRFRSLRATADPLADACIEAIVSNHGRLTNMFDLLCEVQSLREEYPVCKSFLDEAWKIPTWMNFSHTKRGQELIAVYSPFMAISLFSALIGGAMFRKAAVVTSMGQLGGENSSRRVDETAFMISKMVLPRGLEPGGPAHETLVRTRLLHAALRYYLTTSGKFNHPTEQAINQHDLAITLGLFGYVNLRSMRHIGIRLPDSDVASFMLMWKYAGYLLGIVDELLPDSLADQQEFFMASMLHEVLPMGSGPREIMDGVATKASKELGLPRAPIQRYLYQMTQYMTGNEYMKALNIEDEGPLYFGRLITVMSASLTNIIDQYVPFGARVLYSINMIRLNRRFQSKDLQTAGHRAKL